jgi:hypothetical protein
MTTQKQNKITTIKTEADVPDDFVMPPIIYSRLVESDEVRNKKIANSSLSKPQGDCREASLFTKVKLYRLGAVRVRGGITSKFIVGQVEEGGLPPYVEHCWVEAKGLVYDWSQGKNLIMKKEDWYSFYDIKETEIGVGVLGMFAGEFSYLSEPVVKEINSMNPKRALAVLNKVSAYYKSDK